MENEKEKNYLEFKKDGELEAGVEPATLWFTYVKSHMLYPLSSEIELLNFQTTIEFLITYTQANFIFLRNA